MKRSGVRRLVIVVLVNLIFGINTASAAKIALDNFASGTAYQSNPVQISSYTVGAGDNRLLVVAAAGEHYSNVTSVTYGGVPLTLAPNAAATSSPSRSELWYLLDPAVGTADIQINLSDAPRGLVFGAISALNVRQQPPEDSDGTAGNNTTLTTLTDNAWVFDTVNRASQGSLTPSPSGLPFGMIEHWDQQGGSAGNNITSSAASTRLVPTAGPVTNTWNPATTHVMAAFAPFPSLVWNDPLGGTFSDSTKWDFDQPAPAAANQVPAAVDEAIFDLSAGPSGYTVTLDNNHTNSQLVVRDDVVTLDLSGFTYTLQEPSQDDRLDMIEVVVAESAGETAELTVSNGTLSLPQASSRILVGQTAGSVGTLTVQNSGQLTVGSGSVYVGGDSVAAGGQGLLTLDGGVNIADTLKVWNDGAVSLGSGLLKVPTIDLAPGGDFNFTGGELDVDTFEGDLTQDGGTLSPGVGTAPDVTNVTEDYLFNNGVLRIELFGDGGGSPVAGVDFDQLVADTVNLAGTLELEFFSLEPSIIGEIFPIISAPSGLSGTFSNVSIESFGIEIEVDVAYGATGVTVEVTEVNSPGDFDLNGSVDIQDLNLVLFSWNQLGENLPQVWISQRPGMGVAVGITELNQVLFNWGNTTLMVVPEPTTSALLVLGGCLASLFRRGRQHYHLSL